MVNVPIPVEDAGFNPVALNESVCPVLIAGVAVPAAREVHSILPSMQYSQALVESDAVRPSSRASMVR